MNLSGFSDYCETPEVGATGKGPSYENGIRYLCNYLGIDTQNISADDFNLIKSKEVFLRTRGSTFYDKFLSYLEKQHRTSYLTRGFIRAALPYFYKFCNFR